MAADKAQFGMIGMAVMGRNLALNVLDHGFRVAAFNRESGLLQDGGRSESGGKIVACNSLEDLVGGARAAAQDHDDDQGRQAGR